MTDPSPTPTDPMATPAPWNLVADAYADSVLPAFTPIAEEALLIAGVSEGARVLDVACGPGTLTLCAARRGARVDALDFSAGMLAQLDAALARESLAGVTTHEGDGQSLPFGDASFDAAFSMFGLFMFPDRRRGFEELRRCLAPKGIAVVASWHPLEEVPFMAAMFEAFRERMPHLPSRRDQPQPLSDADAFRGEMIEAGFRDVEIREVRTAFEFPTLVEGWRTMQRTMAPLALLAEKMGPSWPAAADVIYESLAARFGEGPQTVSLRAWLGVGRP